MKEPLHAPFEATEPDLVGPRLVHEAGGEDRHTLPSFCDALREARLRGGYSLADAAQVLRIQEHYLQALEEGRFGQIPGTTYAIGFLRSYAGFLGLDPDEIIDAFKREQGRDPAEHRLAFPSPSDTSPKPKFWLILLVLVLAGLAYGGWQYQSTDGKIATDLVADVSTRLTEAVGLDASDPQPEANAVVPDSTPGATASADPVDPVPAQPAPAAPRDAAPAPAAGASGQAAPEGTTEVTALEVPPADSEPALPPRTKVEAVAEAAPGPSVPAGEAEPLQSLVVAESSAAAEPVGQVEVVEPNAPSALVEPAASPAEATSRRPAIAAPLDLAAAQVGGTSSSTAVASAGGDAQPGAPSDSGAAAQPPPQSQATIDARPEETASLSVPETLADEESWSDPDAGYVPKVYGRSNTDARVVITAADDSWVQVMGPDNELLLTRILHAGDSYRVPDRPGLVMVTGNAGGLDIKVDDGSVPSLGPLGVVMRNIALDPDRLLAGTATGG